MWIGTLKYNILSKSEKKLEEVLNTTESTALSRPEWGVMRSVINVLG